MKAVILGLPFSGKTTLFNALTARVLSEELSAGHASEPQLAVVPVYDSRLDFLQSLSKPKKLVPAQIEYSDFAWTTKTTGTLTTMTPQISFARTADTIIIVLRSFQNPQVAHPLGEINPQRDLKTLDAELILCDLDIVEKRLEKVEANLKKRKEKDDEIEYDLLLKCKGMLDQERPLRESDFDAEGNRKLKGFQFLTAKPQLIIVNIDEERLVQQEEISDIFKKEMPYRYKLTEVVAMAGKLEMELCQLVEEDRKEFMMALGLKEMGVTRISQLIIKLSGLITFFTMSQEETRARTIPQGTNALQAAGSVHTDMERGFIRAEVISFEDLMACGTMTTAKDRGLLRLEGKEYNVRDGDVIHFRFHV